MLGPAWRVERGFAAPFCSFVFCCQVVSSSFQFSDLFDRRWHLKPKMVQILGHRAEISWAYLTAALWSTSIRMLLVLRWEEMSHGAWSCSLLFDNAVSLWHGTAAADLAAPGQGLLVWLAPLGQICDSVLALKNLMCQQRITLFQYIDVSARSNLSLANPDEIWYQGSISASAIQTHFFSIAVQKCRVHLSSQIQIKGFWCFLNSFVWSGRKASTCVCSWCAGYGSLMYVGGPLALCGKAP